ncbi:creatininase family protein [Caulobacter hibisci]|uniref:Creatininase family protein n=1 Tax=Caulobacter hibisci TaxID=2035993 RepID=A0ABS0T3H4_9CAUL|nr:creatininase family protein [Caulobacter hibisci]MBI1686427.1 creatininase family protein [Caulobacter hibisci]
MRRRTAMGLLAGAPALGALIGGVAMSRPSTPGKGAVRTMLEMTFPEFEAAVAKTDICLVPVGAIEAHGPHLPLGADALGAVDQLGDVQAYLRDAGVASIIGPPLNIGITNEAGDDRRDGTYIYPGSLTIGSATFVALYVDLLRSLRVNGLRRVFLYSGHLGGRHLTAMASAVIQANREVSDLAAYALIDSERLTRLDLAPSPNILPIVDGLNFAMLKDMLGGAEPAFTTHADGWETSLMLHYRPELVAHGYARLPQSPSLPFLRAGEAGDRTLNPSGIGGFPTSTATADVGRRIAEYRTRRIGDAMLGVLRPA